MMTHGVTAEDYARIVAKVQEPDLDWDRPDEFDLLDRTTLTESAQKILDTLLRAGYVVERLEDLALDELDRKPSDSGSGA